MLQKYRRLVTTTDAYLAQMTIPELRVCMAALLGLAVICMLASPLGWLFMWIVAVLLGLTAAYVSYALDTRQKHEKNDD